MRESAIRVVKKVPFEMWDALRRMRAKG
jgi:hypothetical protein